MSIFLYRFLDFAYASLGMTKKRRVLRMTDSLFSDLEQEEYVYPLQQHPQRSLKSCLECISDF
jgi:hypothetical protein